MPHRYQITVQPVDASGSALDKQALDFVVTNHDDLMQVLLKTLDREAVPTEEAAEFIVGLKLFTEVVLRHRKEDLFREFFPHITAFMTRLKALPTKTTA